MIEIEPTSEDFTPKALNNEDSHASSYMMGLFPSSEYTYNILCGFELRELHPRWLEVLAEEEMMSMLKMQEQGRTGWLTCSTSGLKSF